MKLDYATLISPFPLFLYKIGSVKCPTLKQIWNPEVTYTKYMAYLGLIQANLRTYCEVIDTTNKEWYYSLTDEEKKSMTIMHFISKNQKLREQYQEALSFFFEEKITWDEGNKIFVTYTDVDDNGNIIPIGVIHNDIWNELCDIILQRCGVQRKNEVDTPKFKNKASEKIWRKLQAVEDTSSKDEDMELPNIISAYATFANGYNITNIWDITVYQLYDQFKRQRICNYFNIQSMSVAAYGDEKNQFDDTFWYQKIY